MNQLLCQFCLKTEYSGIQHVEGMLSQSEDYQRIESAILNGL